MNKNDKELNMNIFRQQKKNINDIKYITFNNIHKLMIEQIKISAGNADEFCVYEIPIFIFGEPIYTISDISTYLLDKLKEHIENKNIIEAKFYEPNFLYIKWSLE